MEMPETINKELFAPCGMDCSVCSSYLRKNNPCSGCLIEADNKQLHCLNCSKKRCAKEKGVTYCYQCSEFPCIMIKLMDRKYQNKYNVSLIANSQTVKTIGLENFYQLQKEKYTCKICSGVIDMHNKACSECGNSENQ